MKVEDTILRDGAYADGDLVHIPLANLEVGPGYRSQLRDMDSLVESVSRVGVLAPLWVEPHPTVPSKYLIFAGRRRYEAARQAAQREATKSASREGIAAYVARYTVPCRIFRNLGRAEQAVLTLTENLVRANPSTMDTAKEMARTKRLIEGKLGRKVTVEFMMALFEGVGRHAGKTFHRRQMYKLLQIGDTDPAVMESAKKNSIAFDYLQAISRLSAVELQLELIESIHREDLTRREVRSIVNLLLSHGETGVDLEKAIQEVRRRPVADEVENSKGSEEQSADATGPDATESGQAPAPATDAVSGHPAEAPRFDHRARWDSPPSGEDGDIEVARQFSWSKEEWLCEVETRGGQDEVSKIEKALGQGVAYTSLDITMMRALHTYGGVPADYLAGYLESVKEAWAGSPWFQQAVTCCLDLLELLEQELEFQELGWMRRRSFGFLLKALCRVVEAYEPDTGYALDSACASRKETP